ncbi:MAG: hypothetical protein ACK6EB_22450, partial [Planctomyces sp.]
LQLLVLPQTGPKRFHLIMVTGAAALQPSRQFQLEAGEMIQQIPEQSDTAEQIFKLAVSLREPSVVMKGVLQEPPKPPTRGLYGQAQPEG